VKVKSLYSEPWPDASQYGSVDNRNGYPHSMHAAGIRFAEGCYQNELACTLSAKGLLRFGLRCDVYRGDCWCCFDNFQLLYQPLPDFYDGIVSPTSSPSRIDGETFDLSGRKVNGRVKKGIIIRNGKKVQFAKGFGQK